MTFNSGNIDVLLGMDFLDVCYLTIDRDLFIFGI